MDQDINVLDILVQSRRNKKAAKKFFRKLLKGLTYLPRVVITDKLKSYGAAKREILPGVEHRQSRYLNNRCENSHLPTRQRERRMQRSSPPAMRSGFSPPMVLSPNISDLAVTCFERGSTAKRWRTASRFGKTLRELRLLKGPTAVTSCVFLPDEPISRHSVVNSKGTIEQKP